MPIPSSTVELAYLAGIIDGEGTVGLGVRKAKYVTPTLQVTNTNRILIDWLLTIGGTDYPTNEKRPNRKPCWLWRTAGREAREIIRAVRPFLRLKVSQADIVLSILPTSNRLRIARGGRRGFHPVLTDADIARNHAAIAAIRALNARGQHAAEEHAHQPSAPH